MSDYRNEARRQLQRANDELTSTEVQRLKYAALELREAMESLTYDRALAYQDDFPPSEYETWQPKKVMQVLLEIDPNADKDSSIAFGIEPTLGQRPEVMQSLGTEKVLNMKTLKKHYDALGSYLHVQSIKQRRAGITIDYSSTLPFAGRALSKRLRSADILAIGLALVGCGNASAAWGAATGNWTLVVLGMLVLGSGGGLLNGETQKAIMSDVPLGRAGMASGISTTARFSGILLGYALLSGVVATATRVEIEKHVIDGPLARRLADAVVAGNSHTIIAQMPRLGPERALSTAHAIYATGFSTALSFAAVIALVSSLAVWKLSRVSKPSALRDRLV